MAPSATGMSFLSFSMLMFPSMASLGGSSVIVRHVFRYLVRPRFSSVVRLNSGLVSTCFTSSMTYWFVMSWIAFIRPSSRSVASFPSNNSPLMIVLESRNALMFLPSILGFLFDYFI